MGAPSALIGNVGTIYDEPSQDARVVRLRKRALFNARVHMADVVILALGSLAMFFLAPVIGFLFLALAVVEAWVFSRHRRWLGAVGSHVVTPSRVYGAEFAGGSIGTPEVSRVRSIRPSPKSGIFKFELSNGGVARVPAMWLADPDEYWEALKLVVPETRGFEWVDGVKHHRTPGDQIIQ